MSQTSPVTNVSNLEAAKLLLDEWKFRQQHCWNLLPRYGLAAAFVSIIPYLRLELFTNYHLDKLIFPWIGWLLALAATWLFMAEQYRCYSVLDHYRTLIGKDRIHRPKTGFSGLLDRLKIRWASAAIFFVGFTILSFLNIRMLKRLP